MKKVNVKKYIFGIYGLLLIIVFSCFGLIFVNLSTFKLKNNGNVDAVVFIEISELSEL